MIQAVSPLYGIMQNLCRNLDPIICKHSILVSEMRYDYIDTLDILVYSFR